MPSAASNKEEGPGYRLTHGPRLGAMTSIRLGGCALAHVEITGAEGFAALPGIQRQLGGEVRPFGRGTNVIASDAPLPLLLLSYAGKEISGPLPGRDNEPSTVLVRAEAGAGLPRLVVTTAALGLEGLEGLSGIPGSVGGSVRMNAGSYGSVTGNCLHSVEIFIPGRGLVVYRAGDLAFGYRSFALPEAVPLYLITAATFALKRGNPEVIKAKGRDVLATKKASQPITAQSAGCVFKNPAVAPEDSPVLPAGKLLDMSGLKGFRLGGMAFSEQHANFLVNLGGGTTEETLALMHKAREKVLQDHGISLETEVALWL